MSKNFNQEEESTPTSEDSRIALERLGLAPNEIEAYFTVAGKGVCLAPEIAKLAGIGEDEAQTQTLITKLVNAGLLLEMPGQTIRYKALPPYAALLKQLEEFGISLLIYVEKCPSNFKKSLKNSKKGLHAFQD